MADSFSFNSVDMSTYGLRLRSHEEPFTQERENIQLRNRAYGLDSYRPPVPFTLDVAISAADIATLKSYLDSIKSTLNKRVDRQLTLDTFTDRYWMARFVSMTGSITTATAGEGEITFSADDPAAFSTTETDNDHTVDEDPEEITETAGGTERVEPVYLLTCDDTLTDTTVIIENETTGETLEWTGDLVADDELEIDVVNCTVKLNDVLDMLTVEGQFPSLLPGANTINVSGFSGTFNATYRARYV